MAKDLLPVFDTSAYITYDEQVSAQVLYSKMPAVVLFELISTSIDKSTFQKYDAWRVALSKADKILTPTFSDWYETSKLIRNLYLRSGLQQSKIKTLRNDALIARLPYKNKGFIVTVDVDDYEIIQTEMKDLQIISANDFFGF